MLTLCELVLGVPALPVTKFWTWHVVSAAANPDCAAARLFSIDPVFDLSADPPDPAE